MSQQRTGDSNVMTSSPRAGGGTMAPLRRAGAKPQQGTTGVRIPHDQIAQRAHELWVKQGCSHGRDQENWFEAERQLKAELARK